MKAIRFFETSGRNYPTTRYNNPEHLAPQQSSGRNFKSPFSYC